MMKWIKASPKSAISGSVLAINDVGDYLIGSLYCDEYGSICCDNSHQMLNDVVAYVPMVEVINDFKEQSSE